MNNVNPNNNTRTFMILLLVCISTILLSGCTQTYSNTVYRTGTSGLVMEFQKNVKDVVYETEQFGNVMFIKNQGATDIKADNPAVLKISYDDYRLTLSANTQSNRLIQGLRGKSEYVPVGDELPVESYFTVNLLTKLREGADTKITYNLCYPYTTELTTVTCIDTKMATNDQMTASACTSTEYNGASGQGGPIVITKIVPQVQLQSDYVRPQFNIYVNNLGQGYVTSSKSCNNADITNGEIVGVVNIEAWVSGQKLQCGPSNSGTLKITSDGESFIKCYLPDNANGYARNQKNYLTPLTVKATYTYTTILERQVQIKRDSTITVRPDELTNPTDLTTGNCNNYEVLDNGKCVTKCEYCARNPGAGICNDPSFKPFDSFSFKSNFGCSCTLAECNSKLGSGDCIKGYCPGTTYCCASNKCASWQVSVSGQCIDKCEYCASHSNDKTYCAGLTTQGQSCTFLTKTELDTNAAVIQRTAVNATFAKQMSDTYGSLITYTACNENANYYCINTQYYNNIKQGNFMTGNIIEDVDDTTQLRTTDNYCKTCAKSGDCTFNNNGISAKITSSFICGCSLDDGKYLKSYNFVPNKEYCNNGKYCCSLE